MAFVNGLQHLEIFNEILVMPVKLQFEVSWASLIFQKNIPDAVCLASTSCNRSLKANKNNFKI